MAAKAAIQLVGRVLGLDRESKTRAGDRAVRDAKQQGIGAGGDSTLKPLQARLAEAAVVPGS